MAEQQFEQYQYHPARVSCTSYPVHYVALPVLTCHPYSYSYSYSCSPGQEASPILKSLPYNDHNNTHHHTSQNQNDKHVRIRSHYRFGHVCFVASTKRVNAMEVSPIVLEDDSSPYNISVSSYKLYRPSASHDSNPSQQPIIAVRHSRQSQQSVTIFRHGEPS